MNINDLPKEIISTIFQFLPEGDAPNPNCHHIESARGVCQLWKALIDKSSLIPPSPYLGLYKNQFTQKIPEGLFPSRARYVAAREILNNAKDTDLEFFFAIHQNWDQRLGFLLKNPDRDVNSESTQRTTFSYYPKEDDSDSDSDSDDIPFNFRYNVVYRPLEYAIERGKVDAVQALIQHPKLHTNRIEAQPGENRFYDFDNWNHMHPFTFAFYCAVMKNCSTIPVKDEKNMLRVFNKKGFENDCKILELLARSDKFVISFNDFYYQFKYELNAILFIPNPELKKILNLLELKFPKAVLETYLVPFLNRENFFETPIHPAFKELDCNLENTSITNILYRLKLCQMYGNELEDAQKIDIALEAIKRKLPMECQKKEGQPNSIYTINLLNLLVNSDDDELNLTGDLRRRVVEIFKNEPSFNLNAYYKIQDPDHSRPINESLRSYAKKNNDTELLRILAEHKRGTKRKRENDIKDNRQNKEPKKE